MGFSFYRKENIVLVLNDNDSVIGGLYILIMMYQIYSSEQLLHSQDVGNLWILDEMKDWIISQ